MCAWEISLNICLHHFRKGQGSIDVTLYSELQIFNELQTLVILELNRLN